MFDKTLIKRFFRSLNCVFKYDQELAVRRQSARQRNIDSEDEKAACGPWGAAAHWEEAGSRLTTPRGPSLYALSYSNWKPQKTG